MALTKIGTDGVKDDAITSGKIPANAVGSSELADQSVTLAKLPHGDSNNNGKFLRANNGADPTFETVNTDLVSDTSPQLGGDLQSNGNDIDFADNDKAIFGTGSDLKLYHTGSASWIYETGTGPLYIGTNNSNIEINGGGSANHTMAKFKSTEGVELYYNNDKKLETKNNGVNIQGVNSTNVKLEMHGHDVLKRSWWGYSTGYNGVTLGRTDVGTASTIFMGVDVTGNSSGSFGGQGNEIVFRNNHQFVTPNAANNNYNTMIRFGRGTSTEGAVNLPHGILFGSDQADANILDDYEEGTWDCSFQTNSGSFPSQSAVGRYTKIGRTVHVQGQVFWGASNGSGSGIIWMTLPFQNTSAARGGFAPGLVSGLDFDSEHQLYVMPEINSYNMYWMQSKPNDPAGGHAHLTPSAFRNYASRAISFAGTYMV